MADRVWRDLDQAELDAQVNLRARWPHHPEVFARWASASAIAREQLPRRLDLSYGHSPGETLDFFPAAGPGPAPLLIFIHGGYWQALDKGDFSYLAPPFVEARIAVASVNYDLAPRVSLDVMVRQIDRAVAWLAHRAAELGCDRTRLVVAGHSAGGHLAVMALLREGARGVDRGQRPLLRGGVSVSGVYDVRPIALSYHQKVLGFSERDVQEHSPLRRQALRCAPLVVGVGGAETPEFLRQQDALVAQWQALDLPVEVVALPGRDHFNAVDALAEREHALHHATVALLRG